MASSEEPVPDGYKVVYAPRFWHHRAKRWVYPRNGTVFRFVVKDRYNRR